MKHLLFLLALLLLPQLATATTTTINIYNSSYGYNDTNVVSHNNPTFGVDANWTTYTFTDSGISPPQNYNYTLEYYQNYTHTSLNNNTVFNITLNTKTGGHDYTEGLVVKLFFWNFTRSYWQPQEDLYNGSNNITTSLTNITLQSDFNDLIQNNQINVLFSATGHDTAQIHYYESALNITYFEAPFYNCSEGDKVLFAEIRNESGKAATKGDIEMTIEVTSPLITNFSYTAPEALNISICLYNLAKEYTTNIEIEYGEAGYRTRRHYYDSEVLTNETKIINLYMIDENTPTKTTFTINDNLGNNKAGTVLEAWKYDIGTNDYQLVEMGRTTSAGTTPLYLEHSKPYQYIIKDGGTAVLTTERQLLDSTTITLVVRLAISGVLTYEWENNFQTSCSFNNVSYLLTCTIEDLTDLTDAFLWEVEVQRNGTTGWTKQTGTCDRISTANPTTFTCDLTGQLDAQSVVWRGISGLYSGDYFLIEGEYMDTTLYTGKGYGTTGLFAVIILTMTLALAGVWNPAVALSFTGLSIVITYWLQLINMPFEIAVAGVMFIAIGVYLMRT